MDDNLEVALCYRKPTRMIHFLNVDYDEKSVGPMKIDPLDQRPRLHPLLPNKWRVCCRSTAKGWGAQVWMSSERYPGIPLVRRTTWLAGSVLRYLVTFTFTILHVLYRTVELQLQVCMYITYMIIYVYCILYYAVDRHILVGGLEHFLFSPIVGMMIQSDHKIGQGMLSAILRTGINSGPCLDGKWHLT